MANKQSTQIRFAKKDGWKGMRKYKMEYLTDLMGGMKNLKEREKNFVSMVQRQELISIPLPTKDVFTLWKAGNRFRIHIILSASKGCFCPPLFN